jgi:hypothetical protein
MKRLREHEAQSPLLAKAQALLNAADPLPESDERMWRIRRELDRPRSRFSRLLGAPRRFRALGLTACLLLFGASALAAVRLYEVARTQPAHGEVARGGGAPAPRAASPSRAANAGEQPTSGQQLGAPGDVQPAQSAEAPDDALVAAGTRRDDQREAAGRVRARQRAQLGSAAHTRAPSAPPVTNQEATSGSQAAPARDSAEAVSAARAAGRGPAATTAESASELVHAALRALRRERDPLRAARLLAQYRELDVAGPLAEEALSLQIEAASALADPRARAWAREYLARYPEGRYRDVAQRALQLPTP